MRDMLKSHRRPALDIETTSLEPRDGDISLIQLSHASGHFVIDVLDWSQRDLDLFLSLLRKLRCFVYNAKFEGKWLEHEELIDVALLHAMMRGGHPYGLAKVAKFVLDIDMPKVDGSPA